LKQEEKSDKDSCNDELENPMFDFDCDICNMKHVLPKMLPINQIVSELIVNDVHLNKEQKELKANITKLDDLLSSHDQSNPDEFIFDYFGSLRNKIDLHREKSIETIHKRSDELIKQLNEIEKICFDNLKRKIKIPEFNTKDIAKHK
jgi:hypothetical protein